MAQADGTVEVAIGVARAAGESAKCCDDALWTEIVEAPPPGAADGAAVAEVLAEAGRGGEAAERIDDGGATWSINGRAFINPSR